jgi:hypothetical protein
MSQSLFHQQKRLHTLVALSLPPKRPKLNRVAYGVGLQACSAAMQKKKSNPLWEIKSQANVPSAVMAAAPMAEAVEVVAVAVVVSEVSDQKVKAVTSATPKALRLVASAQRAVNVQSAASVMWNNAVKVSVAKAAALAKTATAVVAVKAEMVTHALPKAK